MMEMEGKERDKYLLFIYLLFPVTPGKMTGNSSTPFQW
jgi:hypothetical protein